uniref:AP2/ERF domain-containing protein n=1 Tax=Euplotes crassus TaxID=5936 RepID=A0A7S3KSN4_EUPCR|mmetsp:Transcript_37604/g.37158  ORF Transcript_37604/g.37158 Transcript_37604/m.37158 type:complete len:213 (+) Transcript_37604:107-745(+)
MVSQAQNYPYLSFGTFETDLVRPEAMHFKKDQFQSKNQSLIVQNYLQSKRVKAGILDKTFHLELTLNQNPLEENKEATNSERGITKRGGRGSKLNINPGLIRLRQRLLDHKILGFTRKLKKTRYTSDKYLGRRSQYIGVSKNNIHWQALINVNYAKKYIGTFLDEIEAARTYDLYALAMQGESASLNFDYTPQEMLEAIEHYLQHKYSKVYC